MHLHKVRLLEGDLTCHLVSKGMSMMSARSTVGCSQSSRSLVGLTSGSTSIFRSS